MARIGKEPDPQAILRVERMRYAEVLEVSEALALERHGVSMGGLQPDNAHSLDPRIKEIMKEAYSRVGSEDVYVARYEEWKASGSDLSFGDWRASKRESQG